MGTDVCLYIRNVLVFVRLCYLLLYRRLFGDASVSLSGMLFWRCLCAGMFALRFFVTMGMAFLLEKAQHAVLR